MQNSEHLLNFQIELMYSKIAVRRVQLLWCRLNILQLWTLPKKGCSLQCKQSSSQLSPRRHQNDSLHLVLSHTFLMQLFWTFSIKFPMPLYHVDISTSMKGIKVYFSFTPSGSNCRSFAFARKLNFHYNDNINYFLRSQKQTKNSQNGSVGAHRMFNLQRHIRFMATAPPFELTTGINFLISNCCYESILETTSSSLKRKKFNYRSLKVDSIYSKKACHGN